MIKLDQLSKSLPSGEGMLDILHPLSLTIEQGQFAAIMGPSGSGKSTMLGLLAGLDTPSQGSITIAGQNITQMDEDTLARFRGAQIGFVFQSFQLIPSLTALENVQVPLEIMGIKQTRPRAEELLEQVGLGSRTTHYPAQLSGGEQQRVAIARAFACRPPVLLADEPTGNLDTTTGERIIDLLKKLHKEEGTTLVMVTHDPEIAQVAERVIRLKDGKVVEDALTDNAEKPKKATKAKSSKSA